MKEFNLPKIFNWQKASEKIVKKYVADLVDLGSPAPKVTELYNDTGVAFTYENPFDGYFVVTSSKDIFTEDLFSQKVQLNITNVSPVDGIHIEVFPFTPNKILILASDNNFLTSEVLGRYAQNALEITMYN